MKKKLAAYNLQELLVVLVIVGILILIAIPNFMGIINKTKSTEALQNLPYIVFSGIIFLCITPIVLILKQLISFRRKPLRRWKCTLHL